MLKRDREEKLKTLGQVLLSTQHFDCLAMGVLDFQEQSYCFFQASPMGDAPLIFDLASLTKPLLLGGLHLTRPDLFSEDKHLLLLNHQASLPSGGRLSGHDWKKQILSYEIKKSPTLYSDYSALRLMLEIENTTKTQLRLLTEDLRKVGAISFWKDPVIVNHKAMCPITGERNGRAIQGEVHDDNAFLIGEFCSHAGLFSGVEGLGQTLLDWNKKFSLVEGMNEKLVKLREKEGLSSSAASRFISGWDTVTDPENTLAGRGAGPFTFGHLGFTGTSIWIDSSRKLGHIILTNATKSYWYDRSGLNYLRKTLGEFVWNNF